MKLLFIHQANQIFGSEKSLIGLLESIVDLHPEVICKPGGELGDALENSGIQVHRLEFGKHALLKKPIWHLGLLRKLLTIYSKAKPDAIVINLEGNTLLTIIAARLLGIPIIRVCRFEFEPTKRWVDRWGWLSSDLVICVSKLVNDQIVSWAPPSFSKRVVHLYNPQPIPEVSESERTHLVEELALDDVTVIGFFGRLHPIKKIETLIDAIPKLHDNTGEIKLLIVGEPEFSEAGKVYAASLVKRASDAGIGAMALFLGHRKDIPALMSVCDLVVLPSESESFGRVLVEAWSVDVPTIASDTSGCTELTQSANGGLLFPVGDSDALANGIEHYLNHPDEAARHASRGRNWVVENCSPDLYAERFLAHVKTVRESVRQ